jgi:hypothetical protein
VFFLIIINNIFQNIKDNKNSWIFLTLLVVIISIIAYYRVLIQINIGVPYDTYDFLANAAEFAGKSIGYTDLRPPFLSFLTSLIFRFDRLNTIPIFYIDAVINILGAIGLYFLLKLRFNDLNSFLGSLLYFTFPILITYIGVGYPDLPSVSISIWALYFTVLAVKRDSKFFLVSFSLAILAFLTKFNQALIIFPMVFYILINWQNIKERRNMVLGMIISFLVIVPVLIFYSFKYGNPLYPFLDFYGVSSGPVSEFHFDYNPDILFYLKLLPLVIGNGASLIILTLIGGLFYTILRMFQGKISIPKLKIGFKEDTLKKISILILLIIFLTSLGSVSYLISITIFFFLLFGLFSLLKNKKNYDLDFLFLSWFGTFLIFISVFLVKDIRYFPMILPPLAYFLIRGLVEVENCIGLIKQRKLTFYLAPLLIVVMLLSTVFYLSTIPEGNENIKNLNKDMEDASQWLINYDHDYKSEVIYSDRWPISGWLLQTNVQKMPQFKDGKTYYNNLADYKPTEQDSEAANNFLVTNKAYYYFSLHDWTNLSDYVHIKKFGYITIYKRVS